MVSYECSGRSSRREGIEAIGSNMKKRSEVGRLSGAKEGTTSRSKFRACVDTRVLKPTDTRLNWKVVGDDNQEVQWEFQVDGQKFLSPIWVVGVQDINFANKSGSVKRGQKHEG